MMKWDKTKIVSNPATIPRQASFIACFEMILSEKRISAVVSGLLQISKFTSLQNASDTNK